jgi:hypothetical protein
MNNNKKMALAEIHKGSILEACSEGGYLEIKPVYAPSIVKAFFRANEWKMLSAETVARNTKLELKQVKIILRRMVTDGDLISTIGKYNGNKRYYWFQDMKKIKDSRTT